MIRTPTVFVLGAGASIPYGFPSGPGLVRMILNGIANGSGWRRSLGFSEESVEYFGDQLAKSGQLSIDAFLEHRQDLRPIGRAAISRVLIPLEDEGRLFSRDFDGGWYPYLLQKMNAPFDRFQENAVHFVTFNYDRSLEHYLTSSLVHTHKKRADDCWSMLKDRFIHVHGVLGDYLPGNGVGRSYNSECGGGALNYAKDCIKIIHEGAEDDAAFVRARDVLAAADRIFILGFAYDPISVQRLHPHRWKELNLLMGTCLGMTKLETNEAAKCFPSERIAFVRDMDCLMAVRSALPRD